MRSSAPTVFLIDDDLSVRRALTRLLKSAGYRVQAFASAAEFLKSSPHDDGPACLILDLRMPGLSGLDLQVELQKVNAILPIIFITGHGDVPTSVKAIKAGASDFLEKPVNSADLLGAIEQALARAAREGEVRAEIADIQRRFETLTPREREVMELVVSGMRNKQIAYELGTRERTIKVHRGRVMEKTEVDSVAELARLAERVGIGKR